MTCLPTKTYSAKPFLAHGYTPLPGLRPAGATLLLRALWERRLCSGSAAGPTPERGRLLPQSVDPLSRKSLHPKELEQGVFSFRAALGEALQSSTLPFCHLHSRFVWEVPPCGQRKRRAALQVTVLHGLWTLQQDVVPGDALRGWLQSRYS